jgi:hypothetical protein
MQKHLDGKLTYAILNPLQQRSEEMQRVSIRTLALMVELLIAVAAYQYLATLRPAKAGAVWLAGNCTTTEQSQPGCAG